MSKLLQKHTTSIKFHQGYWTVFSGHQPVLSFPTLAAALEALK